MKKYLMTLLKNRNIKNKQRPSADREERILRKEARFGCSKCGKPYLEYHHIIPYAKEQHTSPEDMIAVCSDCHVEIANFAQDLQYQIKKNPANLEKDILKAKLSYDKRNLIFRIGGGLFKNTPIILQYYDIPIISCKLINGQAKISLTLFNKDGKIIFCVKENEITFRINDLWDFQYKFNYAIVHCEKRKPLTIDFKKPEATITGKIWLGGKEIKLNATKTTLPNSISLENCTVKNTDIGIQIGENSKNCTTGFCIIPIPDYLIHTIQNKKNSKKRNNNE